MTTDQQKGFSSKKAKEVWEKCRLLASIYDVNKPSPRYVDRTSRLLFMTAAHESGNFIFRRQRGFGINSEKGAWGLWQVEWISMLDSLRILKRKPNLLNSCCALLSADHAQLLRNTVLDVDAHIDDWQNKTGNKRSEKMLFLTSMIDDGGDMLNGIMARAHYLRDATPIPDNDDDLAKYAKRVYNTEQGKATSDQYKKAFQRWLSVVV